MAVISQATFSLFFMKTFFFQFVHEGLINNNPPLAQIRACHRVAANDRYITDAYMRRSASINLSLHGTCDLYQD